MKCAVILLSLSAAALAAPFDSRFELRNAGNTAWRGVVLADPGANRFLEWNDATNTFRWGTPAGGGDVVASGVLTNNTLIIGQGTTTVASTATGTGVLTALGVNTGSAGAFVVNGGALGTPSSGTLTNATGLPIAGITGLGAGVGTWLATPSSANLLSALTTKTGTGLAVFDTSPAFTTSVTTASGTFAVFNTGATTVNAFGAATTLNLGTSAAQVLNFGGAAGSSEFRFLEPSGSGTNFIGFKAGAMAASTTYTLPLVAATAGQVLAAGATPTDLEWVDPTAGTGDVVGPAMATDEGVVRYDGATGKLIQDSTITIDDSNNITFTGNATFGTDNAFDIGAVASARPRDVHIARDLNVAGTTTAGTVNATNAAANAFVVLDNVDQSHGLSFIVASDLTATRNLTITTGDANRALTLTGDLAMSGAFNLTHTVTGNTNVTYPTSGTLATVGGGIGAATATTPAAGDNDTSVATTAFVQTERKVVVKITAANYTVGTTNPLELYGGIIYVTAAATITVPAYASGYSFTVITIGAVAVSVDPNAADLIYLDGVALSDGDKITNTSTAGDMAVITDYDSTGFYAATNGWTDGN